MILLNYGVGEDLTPLDSKEIKTVNPKGNQPWIFIGRTDAEAETPILWPPDAKSRFIWKDPDAGKAWRHEEKGMTEDEMVGWHHQLNGREFAQALGDGEDGEAWHAAVHEVAKNLTWLSYWTTITSICHNFFLLKGLHLIFLLVHINWLKFFSAFVSQKKKICFAFGFWKIFLLGMEFWFDSFFSVNTFKDVAPLSSDYVFRNGKVPILFFNPSGCFLDFFRFVIEFWAIWLWCALIQFSLCVWDTGLLESVRLCHSCLYLTFWTYGI